MANYLFIVAAHDRMEQVSKFVGARKDEVKSSAVGHHLHCWYLSRGVDHDWRGPADIFKGHAVDHERRQLIFSGSRQAPSAAAMPNEGCYPRIEQRADTILVAHDVFGVMPCMFFATEGLVAVSDSLFVLTRVRKALGLSNQVDEQILAARTWINSFSAQSMCSATCVQGVDTLLCGHTLAIDIRTQQATAKVTRWPAENLFQSGVADYVETIREGAQRICSLLRTLAGIPDTHIALALSGGLDSRLCLAAATRTQTPINLISLTQRKRDFAVAAQLAEHTGIALNKSDLGKIETEKLETFPRWFLSNAGVYDCLYSPHKAVSSKYPRFSITGHGAGPLKGAYGWRRLRSITKHIPEVGHYVQECSTRGLQELGIDPQDKWGSEWHYLGFRNAIHAGRSTMTSLVTVRPIMQRKLVGLSRSLANRFPAPKRGGPSIVSDLLVALSPELAAIPFDVEHKNLNTSYIEQSKNFVGLAEEGRAYDVYGHYGDVHPGPPTLFLELARGSGFKGQLTAKALSVALADIGEFIPPSLQPLSQALLAVVSDITDPIPVGSRQSMAAGKLLSFSLFE